MILYLRLLSDERDDFVKEIAIDDTQSFAMLHDFIQELLDYDPSQMASFFTTDDSWNKDTEITLMDMGNSLGSNCFIMEDTLLQDYVFDKGQRLLYVFDYFSERAFFIETFKIVEGTLEKPMCYRNEGKTPEQISIGDLTGNTKKRSWSFDEDEFDGSIDTLDFTSLEDIDLDSEEHGYY